MKVFNFQDTTHKTDFGTSSGRTVFHLLKKPVGNQYLKVLRIFVPTEILVPLEMSEQLRRTTYIQGNIFPDPIHKIDFDIYAPVTSFNFPKKLAPNKYMSTILEYHFPLRYYLFLAFSKKFKNYYLSRTV